jgi:integrase
VIGASMIDIKRPHVVVEPDRHGNLRVYFRKGQGPRERVREQPGTEEFDRHYHDWRKRLETGDLREQRTKPRSFAWLCQQYFASAEFRALGPKTQRVRRHILEDVFTWSIGPGDSRTFATYPLLQFKRKTVKAIRDRRLDTPEQSNARVKHIRAVFAWALDNEIEGIEANPARDLPFLPPKRVGGFPTWTSEDIAQFEQRHPVGTKARVALDLLRYTGVRRSDVILLGRQHLDGAHLSFTTFKGRTKTPVRVDMEIGPALQASLDAGPVGDMVFLLTEHGKPYTHAGFGNWFGRQCGLAELKDRSAHGLRKAAATAAAEEGLTAHQLMARFGWLTLKQAERYTRAADRKRLGLTGSRRINRSEGEQKSLTSYPTNALVREKGGEK